MHANTIAQAETRATAAGLDARIENGVLIIEGNLVTVEIEETGEMWVIELRHGEVAQRQIETMPDLAAAVDHAATLIN